MVMAYAFQGALGLPDRGYYFDKNKADTLAAYERHIAKVLQLSAAPPADAATQARDVVAFETRLAKESKSSAAIERDRSLLYTTLQNAVAHSPQPEVPVETFLDSQ